MSCSEKLTINGTFDGSKFTDTDLVNTTITNGKFQGGMDIASSTGAELVDGLKEPLVDVIREVVETNLLEKLGANEGLFDDLAIKNSIELSLQAKSDILEALTDELKEEFADAFAELIKEEQSYHMNGGSITGSTTIYASAANSIFRAITSRLESLIEESLKKAFCDLDALEGVTLKDSTLEGCVSLDDKAKEALADALGDAIAETIEEVMAGIKEFVGAEVKDGKLTGAVELDDDAKKSLAASINNAISDDIHKLLQDNFECWAKDAVWGDISTVVEDVGFKLNEETGILTIIVKNVNVVTGERSEEKIEVPVSSEDPDYIFTDQGVAVDGDKLGKDVEFVDKGTLDKYEEDFGKLKKDYEELLAKCEDLDPKIKELLDKLKEVQDGHSDIWDFMEYLEECGGCAVNRPQPLVGINQAGERVEYTIPRDAADGTCIDWVLADIVEVVDWGRPIVRRDDVSVVLPNAKKVPNHGPSWTSTYANMFKGNSVLDTAPLREWDTSSIKSMSGMFFGASLAGMDVINGWDVSSVEDMSHMFRDNYIGPVNFSNWNTRSLRIMDHMFEASDVGDSNGLEALDTSNVVSMRAVFRGNVGDLIGTSLEGWDTSKVEDMYDLFSKCIRVNFHVGQWDVGQVKNMWGVFNECPVFEGRGLESWDVRSATTMRSMLIKTNIGDIDLSGWDTTNLENMSGTFLGVKGFTGRGLENWSVSKVSSMTRTFDGADDLDVDLSGWVVPLIPETPDRFTTSPHMTEDKLPQWGG